MLASQGLALRQYVPPPLSRLCAVGRTLAWDDDWSMSFEARCPQCVFVTQQLGESTPCLLHVAHSSEAEYQPTVEREPALAQGADYDEPYAFGQRITVDRPGPFLLREYVRLQLLRTRIQASPSALDAPARRPHARSLSRR